MRSSRRTIREFPQPDRGTADWSRCGTVCSRFTQIFGQGADGCLGRICRFVRLWRLCLSCRLAGLIPGMRPVGLFQDFLFPRGFSGRIGTGRTDSADSEGCRRLARLRRREAPFTTRLYPRRKSQPNRTRGVLSPCMHAAPQWPCHCFLSLRTPPRRRRTPKRPDESRSCGSSPRRDKPFPNRQGESLSGKRAAALRKPRAASASRVGPATRRVRRSRDTPVLPINRCWERRPPTRRLTPRPRCFRATTRLATLRQPIQLPC